MQIWLAAFLRTFLLFVLISNILAFSVSMYFSSSFIYSVLVFLFYFFWLLLLLNGSCYCSSQETIRVSYQFSQNNWDNSFREFSSLLRDAIILVIFSLVIVHFWVYIFRGISLHPVDTALINNIFLLLFNLDFHNKEHHLGGWGHF